MNQRFGLKVIESYNEKSGIYTIKDNCDRKSAEKNVRILYDCIKDKIAWSRICPARLRQRAQFVRLGVGY